MESYSVINQTATPQSNLQNSTVAWSWWPEVNTDSDDDELIKISQNGKKKKIKRNYDWNLQTSDIFRCERHVHQTKGLVPVKEDWSEFIICLTLNLNHVSNIRPAGRILSHHVIIWVFHVYGVMYASILVYIKVVLTTFICLKKNHIFPNQAEMKKPFVMKATWLLWQQSLQWSQVVTLHIIFSLHIINRSLQYL